ncbi:MAG: glutamate formimidoyltransferase [Armatimonadota bacterium]
MAKLFQCVPNFSEGRRQEVVQNIVNSIKTSSSVTVADFSADFDHNRCVITLVGPSEEIEKAILASARTAVELIDLNHHQGVHPRIGAVDVIPITPLAETSMDDAKKLAHTLGSRIASELAIPVYFYEESASSEQRRALENIRRGGFESLKEAELAGDRTPDLGPHKVHPTAGAVAVGARGPLIAYNVNLATDDLTVAQRIASKIRAMRKSGEGMHGVKAIGLFLDSRGIAQVSFNITRPDVVGLWEVYSFVEQEARKLGVEILESELVGLVREEHLINALSKAMRFAELTPASVLENWIPR